MTAIIRGNNLTEEQLRKLVGQARTNPQLAKKLERGQYESEIETTIVRAMQLDGWRALKQEYNFDVVKKLTLGEPGMCDHLFLRSHNQGDPRGPVSYTETRCYNPLGDILWWEFKASARRRKRKEYLSPDQVLWIDGERRKGFLIWVAGIDHEADIAGAALHYLESGLCRRRELFLPLIPPEGRPHA